MASGERPQGLCPISCQPTRDVTCFAARGARATALAFALICRASCPVEQSSRVKDGIWLQHNVKVTGQLKRRLQAQQHSTSMSPTRSRATTTVSDERCRAKAGTAGSGEALLVCLFFLGGGFGFGKSEAFGISVRLLRGETQPAAKKRVLRVHVEHGKAYAGPITWPIQAFGFLALNRFEGLWPMRDLGILEISPWIGSSCALFLGHADSWPAPETAQHTMDSTKEISVVPAERPSVRASHGARHCHTGGFPSTGWSSALQKQGPGASADLGSNEPPLKPCPVFVGLFPRGQEETSKSQHSHCNAMKTSSHQAQPQNHVTLSETNPIHPLSHSPPPPPCNGVISSRRPGCELRMIFRRALLTDKSWFAVSCQAEHAPAKRESLS